MKYRILCWTLGLLCLGSCHHYNGETIPTPAEGSVIIAPTVSNQRINAFAEDRQGHIWMGTLRGLNRFDSHQFLQFFCTDEENSLPDNQINALHSLQDGRLCVATVFGVAFTTQQGTFHRVPVEDGNWNMGSILETRSGKLLFSGGSHLYCYFPQEDIIRPVVRDINAFGAPGFTLDREDRLWVISGGGTVLNCYSTQDWKLLSSTHIAFTAYHIADAMDGTLWLSGMGQLAVSGSPSPPPSEKKKS